jgi:polyhydroxyalkanoate synthase
MQGAALEALGFGPAECRYRVAAAGARWRLRDYGGPEGRRPVLIVTAPIKRPYIWDLTPAASVIGHCLRHRLRLYLLEWTPPREGDVDVGLDEYADRAIGEAVARIYDSSAKKKPVLMAHSLGGTFAAIFAALHPRSIGGLALLASPLCFPAGVSGFRDALVALTPAGAFGAKIVPGSVLSQLSAMASPRTFVWSRLADAALSLGDGRALDLQARIERWTLDEAALPGKLVDEVLQWLYRDNRLCRGTLGITGRPVGPADLRVPTLAVVNTADEIAPPASVVPFIQAMPTQDARVIEHPGEPGIGLQHLAILAGPATRARVWPEILGWLDARC